MYREGRHVGSLNVDVVPLCERPLIFAIGCPHQVTFLTPKPSILCFETKVHHGYNQERCEVGHWV